MRVNRRACACNISQVEEKSYFYTSPLVFGCPFIYSTQRAVQGSVFAALPENNSSGKLLAAPVVLLGQSGAPALVAQPRGAAGA